MVRRSINLRVLVLTLVIGGALAAGVFGLHYWQVGRTAKGLIALADAKEKEDPLKAAEYLDRYLRLHSDDHVIRIRLATTYGALATSTPKLRSRAAELYYRAIATGDKDSEVRLRCELGELLLIIERFHEAAQEAKAVLDREPENSQALRIRALALTSQFGSGSLTGKDLQDLHLLSITEAARKQNPDSGPLAMRLAVLYRNYPQVVQAEQPNLTEPARWQRADESLDQLVRDNPEDFKAFLTRYDYRRAYSLPEAASDLAEAERLAPDEPAVLFAAGNDAVEQAVQVAEAKGEATVVEELLARAAEYFEKLIGLDTNDLNSKAQGALGLGTARLLAGDVDRALTAWRDGLAQLDKFEATPTARLEFLRRIAEACADHGRLSEAGEALDTMDGIIRNLSGIPGEQQVVIRRTHELRRARWHLLKRDLAAAMPLLSKVIASHANSPVHLQTTLDALLVQGGTYTSIGEWRAAAAAYEEATRLAPTMQRVRIAAADAWLFAGRADEALKQAEAAINLSETPAAWLSVALAQLQVQRTRPPTQRNWNRLLQALDALERQRARVASATPWQIDLLRAEYLVSSAPADAVPSGAEQAADVLQAAETFYGKEQRFWLQVCLAYAALKRPADADRALAEFRKSGASAITATLLEARLASQRQQFAQAKAVLTQALQQATTLEQQQLRAELFRVALDSRDLDQARNYLLAQHQQSPKSVAVLRKLAEIDLERRDLEAVKGWERALAEAGPHGEPLAGYFGAWRVFVSTPRENAAPLTGALEQIGRVVKSQPEWAEAVALKAMIEHRMGQLDKAVMDYEAAVRLGERRTLVFEQLIALLDHLQRPADVERYLARLEADVPLSQRLAEMATVQELRHEQPERGLEIARKNAAQRPNDPQAHLWLARLLMVNNLPAEAEQSFQKAVELAPANPQAWNALLSFFSRSEKSEQLRGMVARLQQNGDLDLAQKELLIGQTHELLGDAEAARNSFTQAVAQAENDLAARLRVAQFFMQSDPQKAKEHLEAALQIDGQSVAAKRMLAIVNAALGDLPAAEQLLSAASADGVTEAEDVRLNVLLLMQQGGQANLNRAVALMEDIVARPKNVQTMDRLLLARLYERQAQITDDAAGARARRDLAEGQLTAVAQAPDPDPTHLAALIQFFVRHGKTELAATWLGELEERVESLPKDDANYLALVIQAQVLTGAASRSEPWLKKLQGVEPASSLRPIALRAQVAQSLDPKANIEDLIGPQAERLLASAQTPAEKQRLYSTVGDVYAGLKRYAAAEQWYRKLTAEAPKQYPVVVAALARQGRIREGIELCVQAAAADDTVQPALVLATILADSAATEEDRRYAEPHLAAALQKFEKDARLLYAAALVRVVQARENESIDLFRKVVQINPRFVPALNNLAMMLAERPADQAEALRLIDEAIAIAGKDPNLLDTKGAILVYCGRTRDAVPLLESATRDAKADPRHHFHLAVAYHDQGKTQEAKTHLQIALQRELGAQVLTPTDQRLLGNLRAALQL